MVTFGGPSSWLARRTVTGTLIAPPATAVAAVAPPEVAPGAIASVPDPRPLTGLAGRTGYCGATRYLPSSERNSKPGPVFTLLSPFR